MGNKQSSDGTLGKVEVERMKRRFQRLSKGSTRLSLGDLQQMPELGSNPLIERLFALFDRDGDGYVTFNEFVEAVDVCGKTFAEQRLPEMLFKLYDLDEDGFVGEEELFRMAKRFAGHALPNSQLREICSCTVQEYDSDGDGHLSLAEFMKLLPVDRAQVTA